MRLNGHSGPADARLKLVSRSLLFIPCALFAVSLWIPPEIFSDSGFGLLTLRSMLEGGSFNEVVAPDPANIARDAGHFQTWWSPGQYLAPGTLVWLGASYGLAISLTVLASTVIGMFGWLRVARDLGASARVQMLFALALVSFRYATFPFRAYLGGEVLLFAVAPWCLFWLRTAARRSSGPAFASAVGAAALLFFAKLTGLVVFATIVLAIGFRDVVHRRKLTASTVALLAGAMVASALFFLFWLRAGAVPAAGANAIHFRWVALTFPISGTVLSGWSAIELLSRLFLYPAAPVLPNLDSVSHGVAVSGLFLMVWIWRQLRPTAFRDIVAEIFMLLAIYSTVFAALYLRSSAVSLEERHFRFAGILALLLLLIALDQCPSRYVKTGSSLLVCLFAGYGLASYATGVREIFLNRYHDRVTHTSQHIVTPAVLDHLRSANHPGNGPRPVVVVPSPEAAIALPGFRVIAVHLDFTPLSEIATWKWSGRVEKIYVVVQTRLVAAGKAEALLRAFVDYRYEDWKSQRVDEMTVYSQSLVGPPSSRPSP